VPNIVVEGPPLPELDRKRELVKGMTEVAVRVFGLPPEAMIVTIRENSAENVGIGGQLLVDRRKRQPG
jgi:4-oxalocrotonate tautomerase